MSILDKASEQYEKHREKMASRIIEASRRARDIPAIAWGKINWERRLACKYDLERFGRTYMRAAFSKASSQDQKLGISKMEQATLEGGKFAWAMPRAGGKTAWCRADMLWAPAFAHRMFLVFFGANLDKALETMEAMRTIMMGGRELAQDFPELFHPVRSLKSDSAHLVRGQTYNGLPTHMKWGSDEVRLPSLLLTPEEAKTYLDHDPDSIIKWEDYYLPRAAGACMFSYGVGGSIRGGNITHPITLALMRPDLVFLDDVQKDQGAESPTMCGKLVAIIDGAIQGLAGPGELLASVMPCTVIAENDVSETYLDRSKRPEWQGERCQMVMSWPAGITDYEIGAESEAGRLWNEYAETRQLSLKKHGDIRIATQFYGEHRMAMDDNFTCSWPERFAGEKRHGNNRELSAQQHAMNLRLATPQTFPAEYQNRPRRKDEAAMIVRPKDLAARIIGLDEGTVPLDQFTTVAFIDIQNELLFWAILSVAHDFSGAFVEYGTWPHVPTVYFTKADADGWGLLSHKFFEAYPNLASQATQTAAGRKRAPFEAKIYHAVKSCVGMLLEREFPLPDEHANTVKLSRLGVDCRWGKASDVVKRVIRDIRRTEVIPCSGNSHLAPSHKQFEEYVRTPGWTFEDAMHPGLMEVKWIWRTGPDGMYYLSTDTSRLKTFLMSRLACPLGTSGAIGLYQAVPERHQMFADHVAGSEYPVEVSARNRVKAMWQERDGKPDNDWLDCAAGCIALASHAGARLQSNPDKLSNERPAGLRRRSAKALWERKHGH